MDTIVAISTPPGRGGIGVVRLSGPDARAVAEALLDAPPAWKPWSASLGTLRGGLDQVVVTYFAAPRSYTAEDVVEIACHGAPVVLRHTVEEACANGARIANPGEFTLRAFLNGRLDLPQAEGVRDLIEATTLYQARIAARQVEGSVSKMLAPLKRQMLDLIALLEAGIDFAEDDVSIAPDAELLRRLSETEAELQRLIGSYDFGKLVHDGIGIAIVGRPNVGKSSLFNRLLQQERAIVTDIPGTTRDLVSESAQIDGIPIRFVDTAGIRQGQDPVESLGIERSLQAMADGDVTLVVVDASAPLSEGDREIVDRARDQGRYLLVGNKCDLGRAAEAPVYVSSLTGEGIDDLRRQIVDSGSGAETGFITSLRQEQLLRASFAALRNAIDAVHEKIPHEMLLLDLYSALQPVDAITGATSADDILNRIFSTFCIGK